MWELLWAVLCNLELKFLCILNFKLVRIIEVSNNTNFSQSPNFRLIPNSLVYPVPWGICAKLLISGYSISSKTIILIRVLKTSGGKRTFTEHTITAFVSTGSKFQRITSKIYFV